MENLTPEALRYRQALYDLWSVLAQGTVGGHKGGLAPLWKGALARQLDGNAVALVDEAVLKAYSVLMDQGGPTSQQ